MPETGNRIAIEHADAYATIRPTRWPSAPFGHTRTTSPPPAQAYWPRLVQRWCTSGICSVDISHESLNACSTLTVARDCVITCPMFENFAPNTSNSHQSDEYVPSVFFELFKLGIRYLRDVSDCETPSACSYASVSNSVTRLPSQVSPCAILTQMTFINLNYSRQISSDHLRIIIEKQSSSVVT